MYYYELKSNLEYIDDIEVFSGIPSFKVFQEIMFTSQLPKSSKSIMLFKYADNISILSVY